NLNWFLSNHNRRTDSWLLVYSPVLTTCIFLSYLLLIWVGPKLIAHPQPVHLTSLASSYSTFQHTCIGMYLYISHFSASPWSADCSSLCQPVDYGTSPLALPMAEVCRWPYFSEVIELRDTACRKSHLTFLHVYHHGHLIFNWCAGVKCVAGGQCNLINSLIHLVMCVYDGPAALGPHVCRYLWWKLTSLLLVTYNLFTDSHFLESMNAVVSPCSLSFSLIELFSDVSYRSHLTESSEHTRGEGVNDATAFISLVLRVFIYRYSIGLFI
uniref:Elongation of very long chain fatty acids protein n=1 Tax=Esox lucius TaxID=8010 RepID=A0A3P8Y5U5_ESOLU